MQKLKTATVTWITYNNCGTFLQAYALQHVVKSFGYENKILDDAPHLIDARPICRKVLSRLKRIFVSGTRMKEVRSCYTSFREEWLETDKDTGDLKNVSGRYDLFLCGSDQIWSPIIKPVNPYFFLYFTDKKKVAYAPSLGSTKASDEWKSCVKPLLQRFSNISVREQQGASLLSVLLGRDIQTVVDPTLLLSAEEWKPLCSDRIMPVGRKYLFCYMLSFNARYIERARKYSHRHGLEFVLMGLHREYEGLSDNVLWGGPSEFLSAVCHADAIITDSFHATVFSILFRKPFFTFQRFKANAWNNQNSRIENLLDRLSIKGRFVKDDNIDDVPPIDYSKVFPLLDKERERSLQYLSSSLKN